MNTETTTETARSTKLLVAGVTALALLVAGAVAIVAMTQSEPSALDRTSGEAPNAGRVAGTDIDDDQPVNSSDRSRAERAALAAVAGTVRDVEVSDDRVGGQVAAYEVDVTASSGAEWDVWLDSEFEVIGKREDR